MLKSDGATILQICDRGEGASNIYPKKYIFFNKIIDWALIPSL